MDMCGKDQRIKYEDQIGKKDNPSKVFIKSKHFWLQSQDPQTPSHPPLIEINTSGSKASGHERLSHRPLRQRADGQPEKRKRYLYQSEHF